MPFTKEYREKHREEIKEYHRKYYLKHKQRLQQQDAIWRKTHKEKKHETDRKYNLTHKEEKREYDRIYRKNYQPKKNILNKQSLRFKEKTLHIGHNPRKGICSDCKRTITSGQIQRTNMHHEKYDPVNPLAFTVELCVKCHNDKRRLN